MNAPYEMSDWLPLDAELAAWRDAGRRATLWLRDDDACGDAPALARLLDLTDANQVPVALAVIPAAADASLVAAVDRAPRVVVVQHGYAHRNHAPAGSRKAELGAHRPVEAILAELESGRETLARMFGPRFAPILVPPWNRIAPEVVARLRDRGFRGVSTFGTRAEACRVAGVTQCNTHVDPIAWHRGRGFVGMAAAIGQLVDHLRARREGPVDTSEPTGILTHHLVLDEDGWRFLAGLADRIRGSGAADWLRVETLFAA